MKIFISHSSRDKLIIDAFVDKVLKLGTGLKDSQIYCTSIQGLGIENGADFREHIKENLKDSTHVFIMVSEDYKKSEVCINEMGAAWAREDCEVVQLLFPELGFHNLGLLTNTLQAGKLDDEFELDTLHEKFKQGEVKIARWNKYKKEFLQFLQSNVKTSLEKLEDTSTYFNQFIQENIDIKKLFMEMQPNLLDCQYAFSDKYALDIYHFLHRQSEWIDLKRMKPLFPKYKYVKVEKANGNFTGGMSQMQIEGFINYDAEFYQVTFLENANSEGGFVFRYFCFVNGRWVFMMKPWHLREVINGNYPYWKEMDQHLKKESLLGFLQSTFLKST